MCICDRGRGCELLLDVGVSLHTGVHPMGHEHLPVRRGEQRGSPGKNRETFPRRQHGPSRVLRRRHHLVWRRAPRTHRRGIRIRRSGAPPDNGFIDLSSSHLHDISIGAADKEGYARPHHIWRSIYRSSPHPLPDLHGIVRLGGGRSILVACVLHYCHTTSAGTAASSERWMT